MDLKSFIPGLKLIVLSLVALLLFGMVANSIGGVTEPALSKLGSTGNEVVRIQKALISKGYLSGSADGIFGENTKNALIKFQRDVGLTADGVAGANTLKALGISNVITRTLKQGSSGDDVSLLQQKLKEQGFLSGSVDGVYGSATTEAVKKMQRSYGLTADGVAGPATLEALGLSSGTGDGSGGAVGAGVINATSSERALLARIISAEARGEPYLGQVAVGAVVLNRVKHPSFPNTLSGVIYQKGAFTAIVDGQFNVAVADSAYRAADDALAGMDPSGGAIYYYNPVKSTSQWIFTRQVITVIGSHRFAI